MKKTFDLACGFDTRIKLEIDTEKITADIAKEINEFWSGADEVLRASKGCVFQCVARRAAVPLLKLLIDGFHEKGSVMQLSEQEGWPNENIGITILDYEIPVLESVEFDVFEI